MKRTRMTGCEVMDACVCVCMTGCEVMDACVCVCVCVYVCMCEW